MWVYEQDTGWLKWECYNIVHGYSGTIKDKNLHSAQNLTNCGPIPCGKYKMLAACNHPHCGPLAIPLCPDALNNMFGRSDFYIHGDSIVHPGQASEGCIVLPGSIRQLLVTCTDKNLSVQLSPQATQGEKP